MFLKAKYYYSHVYSGFYLNLAENSIEKGSEVKKKMIWLAL